MSQTDTLNKFTSNGKKQGYWKQYLDLNANPIDSVNSYYFSYDLYDNGVKLIGVYKQKSKKDKLLVYSQAKSEMGKPTLLSDTLKWYDKKTQKIHQIEVYSLGHPIRIEYYSNYNSNKDSVPVLTELVDYTKRYNNEMGSYYYKFTWLTTRRSDEYWFRKVEGKWKLRKIKQ
jgi:hypothetical protein